MPEEELAKFSSENADLKLFGEEEGDTDFIEESQDWSVAAGAKHVELHESKAIADLLGKLESQEAQRGTLFRAGQTVV